MSGYLGNFQSCWDILLNIYTSPSSKFLNWTVPLGYNHWSEKLVLEKRQVNYIVIIYICIVNIE